MGTGERICGCVDQKNYAFGAYFLFFPFRFVQAIVALEV